ncbi:10549_t:CDS:2 [Ambispora gerdemannii]|uniref:10549_t:CDS:1 n=1 Tax=Ambispora gerdemannii TaxID=144530 RepID=A0A9N9EAV5_9GLOM|nr:10549_t:CDS:2 [Ambispora gerdemannii]
MSSIQYLDGAFFMNPLTDEETDTNNDSDSQNDISITASTTNIASNETSRRNPRARVEFGRGMPYGMNEKYRFDSQETIVAIPESDASAVITESDGQNQNQNQASSTPKRRYIVLFVAMLLGVIISGSAIILIMKLLNPNFLSGWY